MTGEGSDFLYPFLDGSEQSAVALLDDLTASAAAKRRESAALRLATLARQADAIDAAADAMADRWRTGGCLFTFGNGGSATDAASMAELFARPPHGRALAARALTADTAVLTALGNDVGFELIFTRQLIAYGRAGDIAVGISTSGGSRNVAHALTEARRRGLLTLAVAGYGGGALAGSDAVTHCLVVESDSVHRIQESQAALVCALWTAVQERLHGSDG